MADRIIENPTINSPYREPNSHFRFDDDGIANEIVPGDGRASTSFPSPGRVSAAGRSSSTSKTGRKSVKGE